jgi:hypothetical protein
MFWDGEPKPAVDVPMGDFFCNNLGKKIAFQSALFSSAEGRSFNCYIPMPFRKSAKVLLVNEGKEVVMLFYDLDFVLGKVSADALYFHAYWSRQTTSKLGDDFVMLPKVNGKGRFLGVSAGLNTDSLYAKTWWGEGEVKMYLDGDQQYPTIIGTGAEDYIGSGWGLGTFTNLYQGCLLASDSSKEFVFYRLHIPDAIYFNSDLKVVIQQIGGGDMKEVRELVKKAPGFIMHCTHPVEDGWLVTEIWNSKEESDQWFAKYVVPNLPQGIHPKRSYQELHSCVTPFE